VIEDLTRDALKLLSFELDDLYAILGCQLLAAGATDASRAYARLARRSAQNRIAGR